MLLIPVAPLFLTNLRQPEISSRSVCDRRLLCDSLKSHLSQFATANHITKAENINQSVYGPQATLRKPGTSINQFTDRRPLYKSLETSIRRIRICKTMIRQSEICNSILYTLVPTTIYFLSHVHSFNYNYILFIRFYTPYLTILYTFFGLASSISPAPNFGVYRGDIGDVGRSDCKEQLGQRLEAAPCRGAALLGELPFWESYPSLLEELPFPSRGATFLRELPFPSRRATLLGELPF
jgi:hypothetical protein